ncbi:unnamed protein product [Sphenostylis stenocarpa]|uniref:Uncharacterized protein n=1 Tax=Sphenostylis stenocarpa TaxID=92480 RepID=A0AA86SIM1_9FABA|nr:unnamed protein product [Sphenostylis stenocarpa]
MDINSTVGPSTHIMFYIGMMDQHKIGTGLLLSTILLSLVFTYCVRAVHDFIIVGLRLRCVAERILYREEFHAMEKAT